MEKKFKNYALKISLFIGKFAHILLPIFIFLPCLTAIKKIPFGLKFIMCFDPNLIRKVYQFNLKPREFILRGRDWKLILNIRDHIGFISYLRQKPFEMSIYHIVNKLQENKRNIVIDLGANVGTASIPICAIKNYELIAVEPSKENASILLKNIFLNNLKSKIYICALGEKMDEKYTKLFIKKGNTGANSIIKGWNPSVKSQDSQQFEYVESKSFDQIIEQGKVEIDDVLAIKIDVEGMEELVLRGSCNFLKLNTAPIILEYRRDMFLNYLEKDLNNIIELLESYEYSIYSLNENGNLGYFVSTKTYENIIALKNNSPLNKNILVENL